MINIFSRRRFLASAAMGAGLAAMPIGTNVSFASSPLSQQRLLFVLLRGGVDGVAAVAPSADPHYHQVRGSLAFDRADLFSLADGFSLSPGLAPLAEFWKRDELAVAHAIASPNRSRSHFEAQAVIETGLDRPVGAADGWLNRLLSVLGGSNSGIAVGAGLPRSLSGKIPVSSWSPAQLGSVEAAFLERLHLFYRSDPLLSGKFEAALGQREIATGLAGEAMPGKGPGDRGSADNLFRATAKLMIAENGPNIAAMEMSGWDTHTNQGRADGALDRLLARLASGLTAFRDEMNESWAGTTVVVMTEFGRTVQPNGGVGTDHGTGSAAFVLGSRVGKSKVIADWPGIGEKQLYEGRDLMPTVDSRAVLKGVVVGTFDLTKGQLGQVFPDAADVPMLDLLT